MSKNCTHFKPKFDNHLLCCICRTCNKQHTCNICASWPEAYWSHVSQLEKRSRAAKLNEFRAFLVSTPKMSSSETGNSEVSHYTQGSRQSHKGVIPIDPTSQATDDSSNEQYITVVRLHKAGKLVSPTATVSGFENESCQSDTEPGRTWERLQKGIDPVSLFQPRSTRARLSDGLITGSGNE